MKRFFLVLAIQVGFLHAQSNEQYVTNDILLEYGQKSFTDRALSMNANVSLDEMSEFVNSACYTCFHAHKPDFEQSLRAELGKPNNGSPQEVIRAKHIKIFVDNVVDDLAVIARNFRGEDRDLFWTLAAKNVTQSMLGLLRGKKDEHGIEKYINRKINLKRLIG